MSRHHVDYSSRKWARLRRQTFDRDGWRCRSCGKPGGPFECDHIKPVQRGGETCLDNLQTLCVGCHVAKTRAENARTLTPAETEWAEFVAELLE